VAGIGWQRTQLEGLQSCKSPRGNPFLGHTARDEVVCHVQGLQVAQLCQIPWQPGAHQPAAGERPAGGGGQWDRWYGLLTAKLLSAILGQPQRGRSRDPAPDPC
jgi:hypothetical protein